MTKLIIGITVLTVGGMATKRLLTIAGQRAAAARAERSINTAEITSQSKTSTNIEQAQPPMTEAQKAQAKLEMKQFLTNTQKALGNDAPGISAFVLIMRQIAPEVVAKDSKIKDLCLTQNQCPLPFVDVYQIGLARLDKAMIPVAKLALQSHMLNSDIHPLEKQDILARHLMATQLTTTAEQSKLIGKDQVQISAAMQYYITTAGQLQSLGVPDDKYVQLVLAGASRSKDEVAKGLIRRGLTKAYPKLQNEIANFKAPQMKSQVTAQAATAQATRNVASVTSQKQVPAVKTKATKSQINKAPQKLVKKGAQSKVTRANKVALK